ncbi:MAG: ribokinase [Tissierellia bacterium]|nr:ribokinase [Tissierellia bacterium]
MDKKVVVIGSINMDLVVHLDEIPGIGETVLGESLGEYAGGKGANQAVALAKAGVNTFFIGKIGDDIYGDDVLLEMKKAGINTGGIQRTKGNTGLAIIQVDRKAQNNIVVIPGANYKIGEEDLEKYRKEISRMDYALFQLEIPLDLVEKGLDLARELEIKTILNPAPAQNLTTEFLKKVDLLIPNEYELGKITSKNIENQDDIESASQLLLDQGVKEILVTLGAQGVYYTNGVERAYYPAFQVEAIDTTGAGDSFIGGLLAGLCKGEFMEKAIERGQATSAITVQSKGAQSAIPVIRQVDEFLQQMIDRHS